MTKSASENLYLGETASLYKRRPSTCSGERNTHYRARFRHQGKLPYMAKFIPYQNNASKIIIPKVYFSKCMVLCST